LQAIEEALKIDKPIEMSPDSLSTVFESDAFVNQMGEVYVISQHYLTKRQSEGSKASSAWLLKEGPPKSSKTSVKISPQMQALGSELGSIWICAWPEKSFGQLLGSEEHAGYILDFNRVSIRLA
jgi:hypothetical protein